MNDENHSYMIDRSWPVLGAVFYYVSKWVCLPAAGKDTRGRPLDRFLSRETNATKYKFCCVRALKLQFHCAIMSLHSSEA